MLLVGGGVYLAQRGGNEFSPATSVASPWIEVVEPSIFVLRADGSNEKELHSGDEVISGSTIKSSASGRANIHLPDGSALRLDKESIITIEKIDFNYENETLAVKVLLLSGRVWSKVVALVTPESSWEVKTSNAVATVRGTAFSTEFKNGKSRILGSEQSVTVKPIDPKTKRVIETAKILVKEKTFVEIGDPEALAVAEKRAKPEEVFPVKAVPKKELEEAWVKENENEDKKLDQKIETIKKEGLKDKELRRQLRKEIEDTRKKIEVLRDKDKDDKEIQRELKKDKPEDFKARLKKRIEEQKQELKDEGMDGNIKEELNLEKGTSVTDIKTTASPIINAKPVELTIVSGTTLTKIIDGKKAQFRAVLTFDNGEIRDVTETVTWKVRGNIGFFESPGLFVAKLREEDSELGDISGGVEAVFEQAGASLISKPIEFIVTPQVDETTPVG